MEKLDGPVFVTTYIIKLPLKYLYKNKRAN